MWIKKSIYDELCQKIHYLEARNMRQLKYNANEKCLGCKHLLEREIKSDLGWNAKDYYCKLNNECDKYVE